MGHPLVVVVDDDESIYEIVAIALSQLNIEVLFFNNAEEALPQIVAQQPDVILMDLHLNFGLKGWEAIGVIKSNPEIQHIPTIAFTAATGLHIRQAMQNGADNFLSKPFTLSQLKQMINQYIVTAQN